ncbi:MAG: aspartate--ammonia ligase [Prevotellaceae bacterium]|jgi:aspartate--ammonia ligase|nr:aspartate--ammonia ligase [Prevotellaceae bacterium]
MSLFIPKNYKPLLAPEITEQAIKTVKDYFEQKLSYELRLHRVTAPLFVLSGTGLNDDLNGIERAVGFPIKFMGEQRAEIVHSLAKWKRTKLASYAIAPGYGIYTDMNAIRADEDLDNLHSLYVDQWDWEMTVNPENRNLEYLKSVVRKIYEVLKKTEYKIYRFYPHISPILPDEIIFIHTEDLLEQYPDLSAKEREDKAAEQYGAVFLIGIGGELKNGKPHDGRAPDYDDWTTPTSGKHKGLNGDILVWNPVLKSSFELSSMGIRVDKSTLIEQLKIRGAEKRTELAFHKSLINGDLPLSIGGGIGQSRLCMLLLRKAHIGEVQTSIWPDEVIETCKKNNIFLK